jgi:hypothetical protein
MGRFKLVILSFIVFGCEIFVDDVGGDGQPCFENHHCRGDLVCNFDACSPPLSLDDACDPEGKVSRTCGNGLVCLKGACATPGAEGEPCSANYNYSDYDYYGHFNYDDLQVGTCKPDLYCVIGVCARYGGEGEPCIPQRPSWDDPCEDGLVCVDDLCVTAKD